MLKHYLMDLRSVEATTVVDAQRKSGRLISRCHGAWAALSACTGILGVLRPQLSYAGPASAHGMDFTFGVILCSLVLSHIYWNVRLLPESSAAQVRRLCRRDSLAVYLLLFCMIGVHEISCLLTGASVAGTAAELQGYVAGGVCALVLIRCSGLFWADVLG